MGGAEAQHPIFGLKNQRSLKETGVIVRPAPGAPLRQAWPETGRAANQVAERVGVTGPRSSGPCAAGSTQMAPQSSPSRRLEPVPIASVK